MNTVRFTCPDPDGPDDVTVNSDHVTVVELAGNLWARWLCPHCGTIGMRVIRRHTADLLARHGCPVERLAPPAVTTTGNDTPISRGEAKALARQLRDLTDLRELA